MRFKVTALKNVEIYGFVRTKVANGTEFIWRDKPYQEWISLRAGEVRDYLGLIEGVDARYAPGQPVMHIGGRPLVQLGVYEPGKVYFGLFIIESIRSGD